MKTIFAAAVWGIVEVAMVCKTSGRLFSSLPRAPWSN